jgi:phosphinothricin acetyltransferase
MKGMEKDTPIVRPAKPSDVDHIVAIYNDVMATTPTIWSETPDSVEERLQWLEAKEVAGHPVLVAESEGRVLGFVSAGPFRPWPGYVNTIEHSIHVYRASRDRGVGSALLAALESELREAGAHVMVAGIDAENLGSIRFHARHGFVEVARMAEVGRLRGDWRDLVLMQKILG